jgi:hypothetical protein
MRRSTSSERRSATRRKVLPLARAVDNPAVNFDDWRDAVDRALAAAHSPLRCAGLDTAVLAGWHASGLSPVIAARQILAAPPVPAPIPVAQTPAALGPTTPWLMASPRLMRVLAAIMMGLAALASLPVVFGLLILLFAPLLGGGNRAVLAFAAMGYPPLLAGIFAVCSMTAGAQIVLVAAEAAERMRRP